MRSSSRCLAVPKSSKFRAQKAATGLITHPAASRCSRMPFSTAA